MVSGEIKLLAHLNSGSISSSLLSVSVRVKEGMKRLETSYSWAGSEAF